MDQPGQSSASHLSSGVDASSPMLMMRVSRRRRRHLPHAYETLSTSFSIHFAVFARLSVPCPNITVLTRIFLLGTTLNQWRKRRAGTGRMPRICHFMRGTATRPARRSASRVRQSDSLSSRSAFRHTSPPSHRPPTTLCNLLSVSVVVYSLHPHIIAHHLFLLGFLGHFSTTPRRLSLVSRLFGFSVLTPHHTVPLVTPSLARVIRRSQRRLPPPGTGSLHDTHARNAHRPPASQRPSRNRLFIASTAPCHGPSLHTDKRAIQNSPPPILLGDHAPVLPSLSFPARVGA